MDSTTSLHIYFLPLMASGHLIPIVDMATLFARHAVKSTIILTPFTASQISKSIEKDTKIHIRLIEFPTVEAGLPDYCQNADSVTTPQMALNFHKALNLLQNPVKNLLEQDQPDCLVADMMFPWATDLAAKFGIPRLVFHGLGFFSQCVYDSLVSNKPYMRVDSDTDEFIVPNLPHVIKLTRQQLADHLKDGNNHQASELLERVMKSELESYGIVVNSFIELEPDYYEHYTKVMGRKAWQVGPLSLCNQDNDDKGNRGQKACIDRHKFLTWLDSKGANSVLYICFGSRAQFSTSQLMEIAKGVEASGVNFIWVVKKEDEKETYLPKGFEERTKEKGLIIKGWAPQVMILDHDAVGGFMTHCGWNSLIESVSAGVPMLTWPLFAEQFYNEKLVTEVLKIGVAVGAKIWSKSSEEYKGSISSNVIEMTVNKLMGSEESEEMRSRAKALGDKAKKAVEVGGSSYTALNSLLDELKQGKKCEGT